MLPILEHVASYIQSKQNLWSPASLTSAKSRLRTLVLISDELDPRTLFEHLTHEGYTLYSIKTYFMVGAGFENYLKKTNRLAAFLKDNAFVFRNAYQDKTVRMTVEDFQRAVTSAPHEGAHNLLVLLGQCGLRKQEALNALWLDFDSQRNLLRVKGKGGKVRYVPLNKDWLKVVPQTSRIVDHPKNGLRSFIERTGFGFHDYRAYFATQVSNHPELTIRDAQVLLGHNSILTTQRYVRVDHDRIHKVLMKG